MALFRTGTRRNGHGGDVEVPEVADSIEETPEEEARELKKAIWHVFHMLDAAQTGKVHVSQLRVSGRPR